MTRAMIIRTVMAAVSMTAGIAAAQHPPSPHSLPQPGPNFPGGLPTAPGLPTSADPVLRQPGTVSGSPSAPGVVEGTSPMAPLLPSYLAEPQRGIPAERTTTAPPSLLKQVAANRIRLADTAKPPSKLAGVDVEFAQGGYLVTRKYED